MDELAKLREAKLDRLRTLIQEGFDSGPTEPLQMDEVLVEAKQRRSAAKPKQD